ncbi:hypothetical protein BIFDEN_02010 [Bifidobacterium dentium ATCC 27678]|nr:hypothetical protein BIFDEN_02010 [Bifidobacterium dentium ATCC 27678]
MRGSRLTLLSYASLVMMLVMSFFSIIGTVDGLTSFHRTV